MAENSMLFLGPALTLNSQLRITISAHYISSIGVAFWMQTGERQTARLRLKYLEAVLNKDIDFFDTEAKDKNILYHISSDAILVQDAIGDKVEPAAIVLLHTHMSQDIASGVKSWKTTNLSYFNIYSLSLALQFNA